jgi:hypothetical protein
VKLGRNASDTCAVLSETSGGETINKSSVFLSGINCSKKARMSKSQMKTMHVTFLDIKSIVHFEFVPQGQTGNRAYCVEILKRLHETVHRKRLELWPNDWIVHHDNAPAHKALFVK